MIFLNRISTPGLNHAPASSLNLRRFLKSSSLYGLGDLLTKSARFILVPYYVQVLTKAELGAVGVLQAVSVASWTLFAFGLGYAAPRFYFEYKDRADRFVAALWWMRMGVALAPCGVLIGLSYTAAPVLIPHISAHLLALAIVSGFLRAGFNIIESWFMIREQPVHYRTFTLLQFITTTSLIIYLVSVKGLGVAGVVAGEVVSFAVWTLISAFLLGRDGRPIFRQIAWQEVFRYCALLLPHTLFMWAIAFSDRLILQRFVTLKELGVYEFAYTLASTLSVAALAMRAAWLPSFYRHAHEEQGRNEFARTASVFFSVIFVAGAALATFAPECIWLLAGAAYGDAVLVMRVLVIGLVGHALFMAFNQPLLYQGKVGLLSATSLLATLANIGFNIWLVPHLGILGAAAATGITYIALAAIAFMLTNTYSHIRWRRATLVGGGFAAVVAGILGCGLPALAPWATFVVKVSILSVLAIVVARLNSRASEFTSEHTCPQDSSTSCSAYSKSSLHC